MKNELNEFNNTNIYALREKKNQIDNNYSLNINNESNKIFHSVNRANIDNNHVGDNEKNAFYAEVIIDANNLIAGKIVQINILCDLINNSFAQPVFVADIYDNNNKSVKQIHFMNKQIEFANKSKYLYNSYAIFTKTGEYTINITYRQIDSTTTKCKYTGILVNNNIKFNIAPEKVNQYKCEAKIIQKRCDENNHVNVLELTLFDYYKNYTTANHIKIVPIGLVKVQNIVKLNNYTYYIHVIAIKPKINAKREIKIYADQTELIGCSPIDLNENIGLDTMKIEEQTNKISASCEQHKQCIYLNFNLGYLLDNDNQTSSIVRHLFGIDFNLSETSQAIIYDLLFSFYNHIKNCPYNMFNTISIDRINNSQLIAKDIEEKENIKIKELKDNINVLQKNCAFEKNKLNDVVNKIINNTNQIMLGVVDNIPIEFVTKEDLNAKQKKLRIKRANLQKLQNQLIYRLQKLNKKTQMFEQSRKLLTNYMTNELKDREELYDKITDHKLNLTQIIGRKNMQLLSYHKRFSNNCKQNRDSSFNRIVLEKKLIDLKKIMIGKKTRNSFISQDAAFDHKIEKVGKLSIKNKFDTTALTEIILRHNTDIDLQKNDAIKAQATIASRKLPDPGTTAHNFELGLYWQDPSKRNKMKHYNNDEYISYAESEKITKWNDANIIYKGDYKYLSNQNVTKKLDIENQFIFNGAYNSIPQTLNQHPNCDVKYVTDKLVNQIDKFKQMSKSLSNNQAASTLPSVGTLKKDVVAKLENNKDQNVHLIVADVLNKCSKYVYHASPPVPPRSYIRLHNDIDPIPKHLL